MPNLHESWPQTCARRLRRDGATLVKPWGRGVGKSHDLRANCWMQVAQWDGVKRENCPKDLKGVRIAIVAPTRKQAMDIHYNDVVSDLAGEWAFLGGTINKTTCKISFPGGSWIQFFGADTLDNVRGLRVDIAIVDEADDVDPHTFDSVMLPWISEPWSFRRRELCGTPRRGRHGLLYRMRRMGQDPAFPNIETVHATYRDAPEIVAAEVVEDARRVMTPATFKREWECDFDAGEGLVYAELWDADLHLAEPEPHAVPSEVVVGVDWGWNDPNAWIVIEVYGSGADAVLYVREEVYKSMLTLDQQVEIAKALKDKWGRNGAIPVKFYGDPSKPSDIEQIRQLASVRMVAAANSRLEGVGSVANFMAVRTRETRVNGRPGIIRYARLHVSRKCSNLINELGTYAYKRHPKNADIILDEIADGNDHALDALRYGIFSRFGLPRAVTRMAQGNILNV